MKIITISGLDGSGKSTQIELLKNHLEAQGQKVFYFHAIAFGLANKISGLGHSERSEESRQKKSVTQANLFQIILRRMFLMIDLLRFRFLLRKLRKNGFDYLISDRYFYDSVINIKYLAKSEKRLPCERFIIAPDKAIYLKTSPENIMSHERKPEQGLEYLQDKEKLYDEMAKKYSLKIINGNSDRNLIFEEIKKYVP